MTGEEGSVSRGNTEGPAMLTLSERDRQISNRLFLTQELLLYSCATTEKCVHANRRALDVNISCITVTIFHKEVKC